MKRMALLGSTGSIGENTVRVVASLPEQLQIAALAVQSNWPRALEQAETFGVKVIAVADPAAAALCAAAAPPHIEVLAGPEGVATVAALDEADIVVCAVVGMAGLQPVLAAVSRGTSVALATKEALVAGGGLITETCTRTGAHLLPIDSEHSALFQCLSAGGHEAGDVGHVQRLILTASGGPFAFHPDVDLATVTVAQALAHPSWDMGPKVTIDSATLMNKGLEIIEAHWLFGLSLDHIDVILHPESIVHSLVEFVDGSMLAQMSVPDMRLAIQYALTYPERCAGNLPRLNLAAMGDLHFEAPDPGRFPCLRLAREALAQGGSLPAVMNAANEIAVEAFLQEQISLVGISALIESVMDRHDIVASPDLQGILDADAWARREAEALR